MTVLLHMERLDGVHPDLVAVVLKGCAKSPWPCYVIEGVRSVARQQQLVAQGASTTMSSRHITGPDGFCYAVDIAPAPDEKPSWAWPLYHILAPFIKAEGLARGILVEWGGDWQSFKDGPHWQLAHAAYPKKGMLDHV